MNKKNVKIAFILNIIIVIMTLFALIVMFTGFKFMQGNEINLETRKLAMFKLFTVDSNVFMGIAALLFSIKEYKIIKGKKNEISTLDYILKLMATTSVGLTFFVVFAYLGPTYKGGILSMLKNSNLFFHLTTPILSIITFIIFEKSDKLRFKNVIYGVLPTIIYGVFYLTNILLHMKNGKVDFKYDWYLFVQNGVWTALIVLPIILIISYLISLILWRLNIEKVRK